MRGSSPRMTAVMSPLHIVQRLADGGEALLLRGPVAAAGDGAVDYQIVAVDKTGFVAGEEHRRVRDVFRQSGALDRLRGLVDFAHHIRGLLGRLDGQAQRLAENT